MRVVLSRQAKGDLVEIGDFIGRDNRQRAAHFVSSLRKAALDLGDMPFAFPLVPRLEHLGVRRRVFRNYLILFRVQDNMVVILRMVHGARDLGRLFFPPSSSP